MFPDRGSTPNQRTLELNPTQELRRTFSRAASQVAVIDDLYELNNVVGQSYAELTGVRSLIFTSQQLEAVADDLARAFRRAVGWTHIDTGGSDAGMHLHTGLPEPYGPYLPPALPEKEYRDAEVQTEEA